MTFNAKNLHYEKREPAFLRKLQGEHGGDRHNVQFARPKKDRLNTADEDDGPTILNESGEVIDQVEYDAMLEGKSARDETAARNEKSDVTNGNSRGDEKRESQPEKQKVAEVGGVKKRKSVKVVGEDVEEAGVSGGKVGDKDVASTDKTKSGKTKTGKKAKRVKLSFDDPEE